MEITRTELQKMLLGAAQLGAEVALAKVGKLKPYLKKAEAFRMYGQGVVERWIKEGLVTPIKDGNDSASWRLDRTELEAVAKTSNRHTYLTVNQRI